MTDPERTQLRCALGQLNWLSGMTRLKIGFTVSEVSSRIKSATMSDIKSLNKTIKTVKTTEGWIHIPKLNLCSLKIRWYTDAGFNNLNDSCSQGFILFLCDQDGFSTAISLSSNKLKRVVRSIRTAETLAFADVALCTKELIGEILHTNNEMLREIECFTDSMSLFETSSTSSQVNDRRL